MPREHRMLHQTTKDGVLNLWPTPILVTNLEVHEDTNLALCDQIQQSFKHAKFNAANSNVGGWHSAFDFFDTDDAHRIALQSAIQEAVKSNFAALFGPYSVGVFGLIGWCNVLSPGAYNSVHIHQDYTWSGVYYPAPATKSPGSSKAGTLELIDPRTGNGNVFYPGLPFGRPINIRPHQGLLIVFPSWVRHFVHPTQEERIAIAFNFNLHPQP